MAALVSWLRGSPRAFGAFVLKNMSLWGMGGAPHVAKRYSLRFVRVGGGCAALGSP